MPRGTYLDRDLYDSLLEADSRNRADRDIQGLGWQKQLDDAISGLQQTFSNAWKPLPIVVSDRPDAMQIREQQQALQPAPPVEQPQQPQQPPAPFRAEDFTHEDGVSTYTPPAPEPGQGDVPGGQPSSGYAPTGEIDNSSREAFVRSAYPYALQAADRDPKLAQQLIATAISENGKVGTGRSLGEMGFNVGGIQGVEGPAGSFMADDAGRPRKFAAYNNLSEGFRAVRDLVSGGRYAQAAANYRQTGDVDRYWREVNEAGYAEDGAWHSKVGSIRANQVEPLTATLTNASIPGGGRASPGPAVGDTPSSGEAFSAGSYTPNQINAATSEGLDYETALAVCGPAAAIAFARKTGRNPTMQEALGLAKQVGWTAADGMAGPGSQRQLLANMGIASRLVDGAPEWQSVAADVQRGNPVIISTPGHYFVAERYDPDSGTFDFGESAAVLKASGGRRWFRPDELESLGMGAPRGTLFMDSPQSPSPSVVAGRVSLTDGSRPSGPSAPGVSSPPPGAEPPAPWANAESVQAEAMSLKAVPMPSASEREWEDTVEAAREVDRIDARPLPPAQRVEVPYNDETGDTGATPDTPAYRLGPQYEQYRQPLSQQPELPPGEAYDPRLYDEAPGARESGQTADDQRTVTAQSSDTPSSGEAFAGERYLDTSIPSPPGWQAIVDGAGAVVDWVRERVGNAADSTAAPDEETPAPGSPYAPGQAESMTPPAANQMRPGGRTVVQSSPGEQDYLPPAPSVFGEGGIFEPAGGMDRIGERIRQIEQNAAREMGHDVSTPAGQITAFRATADPEWRRRNPETAAEYDQLQQQFGLTVMGQAGDAAKFGRAGKSWDDVSRQINRPNDPQPMAPEVEPQVREQFGRRWQEPGVQNEISEGVSQVNESGGGRAVQRPEELSGPVRIEPQSISLNALPGVSPGVPSRRTIPPEATQPRNISSASDVVEEIRRTGMTSPARVVEMIGERPEYLKPVAEIILEQRRKVVDGTMTPRDVAKAYYMTIASQGADAIKVATVEAKVPGFKIPEQFWSAERATDGSPLVRPEEAAAAWLFTPRGQAALDAIERGVYDASAWADGAAVRRAFGDDRFKTTNILGERAPVDGRTKFNMQTLPAFTEQFNNLAQRVARGEAPVQLLDRFTKRLNGVREAKAPFLMHALGFGDSPTIDAVEINTWLTGKGDISRLQTKEADFVRTVNEWLRDPRVGSAMRERITQQFDEVRQLLPPEATADLPPEVFNHVLHHWIWDRMKGISTTHEGFYNALRTAATFGQSPARAGSDVLAQINADIGSSLGSSTFGAAAGAALPAETDEERARNAMMGAAAGLVGGPIASRALRGRGGALATPGVSPGRPDPANPRRLRGRPIEMTPAQEVSRLRLDKFPEEVRADIEAAAKGINFAHEQRRGVLPDAVVQQMAADDLRSVDQLIKQGKVGRAYNAEETVAVRNAVASQAQVVRELSQEIAEARAAGHAPELLVARRAAEATKLDGLVKLAEGARAEAGRTLRAYRQQANLIELNPNEAVERIYKKLGGRDNATEAVDEYTKLVEDGANPIQLAKFWAKVESGKITGSDLFSLYRRFNMLSGPRTIEVNALSGAVNLGYEILTSAIGQTARGRGGEAVAELAAPIKASGRAFKNMAETMWHGVSTEQAARGDIPRSLSSRTDNRAAKGALTVLETPDRFNAAVDQFYRTMTEDWAATKLAHQQAREAKLNPRSSEWAETVAKNLEAIRDDPSKFPQIKEMADHVTFSEEPGAIGKGLEAFRQKAPLVANLVMPFIRTPYNIASRAIDISPMGFVRTGVEAATGKGRGTENISRRLRDNLIGTGAAVWAYDQAQQGNITGAGPDDPEKIAQLRATGWQPYSVKIGDEYWSYANFAPFSLTLSLAAAAAETQKYKKPGKEDALSMLSDGAARTAKVVTDMTVLAGIGAIVKSIQDPDRYGTQWLSQFLQTLIPAGSLLNTVGQATDPLVRRSERTDVGTQISQNLQARVPGLRENVPAAQDPLGRPIPNEQTGAGALNPFRPTTERPDPTLQLFLDAGVDIGAPKKNLTVRPGTAPLELSAAEQRRWNELRGAQLVQMEPRITGSQSYQGAQRVGRETVLKRILNQANESADRQLMGEIGQAELRRRMTEAAQKKAS